MCPIPNGFRDSAMNVIARIKERQDALSRATRHVLTRVAKCIQGERERPPFGLGISLYFCHLCSFTNWSLTIPARESQPHPLDKNI
jgi:hypothetical protein